jgi:hypothetical protein
VDTGLVVQNIVVGVAVTASAGYVVATRFGGMAVWRRRVALVLLRSGSVRAAALARRIAPAPAKGPCGDCGGCAS